MDYAYFLKGSEDAFDDEKKERIRSDLASIVLHNPGLAEKVAEEYGKKLNIEKQALAGFFQEKYHSSVYLCRWENKEEKSKNQKSPWPNQENKSRNQKTAIKTLNDEKKVLASAADFYQYFRNLKIWHERGDYQAVEKADTHVIHLRRFNSFITSTRIFYRTESNEAQIVHNYGSDIKKPLARTVVVPAYSIKSIMGIAESKQSQEHIFIKTLFETKDELHEIANVFSFIYDVSLENINITTPATPDRKKILQGVVAIACKNDVCNIGCHFMDNTAGQIYYLAPVQNNKES